MAEEAQVTPAPGAESSSTPPPTGTQPASPGAVSAPETKAEPSAPLPRREVIAEAMAKKAEKDGDASVRQKLIDKGLIKPAQPGARGAHAAHQPRDQGKFAGPPAKPNGAAQQAPQVTQAQPAPIQRPPLPKYLKKELEGMWNEANPDLLKAFSQYGEDATRGIEKYKLSAQSYEALAKEFQPYQALIQAEGGNPQVVVRNLLSTASSLRTGTPYEKAQLVARIMQSYGIPQEHVAQMFGQAQQGQPPVAQPDQQVQALYQRINQLEQAWQGQSQATQEAETQRIHKIAESFAKDRPHYEELRPQIARLINGGLIEGNSELEILGNAYDAALRLNPALFEQHLSAEREKAAAAERDKANQQAQASRAAAVQVKGAPGGVSLPAIDPKDRRTAIRHAIAVHTR